MLDESFRRRVGRMARSGEIPSLSQADRERLIADIVSRGSAIVADAERTRRRRWLIVPVLAAAAVLGFTVLRANHLLDGSRDRVADHVEDPTPQTPARACESRGVPGGAARGFVSDGARARADLGRVAVLSLAEGGEATFSEVSPCKTTVSLAVGRVVVHAKDLGGGELTVRAGDSEVRVVGTLFSVDREARDSDALKVQVVEGTVRVRHGKDEYTVSAGHRLMLSAVGAATGPLDEGAAAALQEAVRPPRFTALESLPQDTPAAEEPAEATGSRRALPPPASGTEKTPSEPLDESTVESPPAPAEEASAALRPEALIAQADARRQQRDYAGARSLYRRAGENPGPTAEAAWLSLARMELSLGDGRAALDAIARRRARFGQGALSPEALWMEVRAHQQSGDMGEARRVAEELRRRWPYSPQAAAARRLTDAK